MSVISKVINVTLDVKLSKAREWYNSGNKTLKELALKAFTEKELKAPTYSEIKTFEDAVKAVGMNLDFETDVIADIEITSKAMAAMYKLSIIRKALNLRYGLHLTKDPEGTCIYYPCNQFVTENSTCYEDDLNSGEVEIIGKFKSGEIEYNVIGGHATISMNLGLGGFSPSEDVGFADANFAFLGCTNKEITKHFGKYFGMLITEAKFGDLDGFEVIEDKYGCVQ